jgi:hypothetical protein
MSKKTPQAMPECALPLLPLFRGTFEPSET